MAVLCKKGELALLTRKQLGQRGYRARPFRILELRIPYQWASLRTSSDNLSEFGTRKSNSPFQRRKHLIRNSRGQDLEASRS